MAIVSKITNINQLEEVVKSYLSNPVLKWNADTPYVLTSTERVSTDSIKESPYGDGIAVFLRVDIDSVLYETIETFMGTQIIASIYNLYLRASTDAREDIPDDEVDDYELKNITSDIIRYMTSYSGFSVCQEVYTMRQTPNMILNTDESTPVFDLSPTKRQDYTPNSNFLSGYIPPSTEDEIKYRIYPYHTYVLELDNGVYVLANDENYLYGWLCGTRLDNRNHILFYGRSPDNNTKGWFILDPLSGICVYRGEVLGLQDYYLVVVTNPLVDSGITKVTLVNTVYQFIDDDDVGREIRNESLLSVRIPS